MKKFYVNVYVKILVHFLNIARFPFPYSSFKIVNIYLNNNLPDINLNYSSSLLAYFLTEKFCKYTSTVWSFGLSSTTSLKTRHYSLSDTNLTISPESTENVSYIHDILCTSTWGEPINKVWKRGILQIKGGEMVKSVMHPFLSQLNCSRWFRFDQSKEIKREVFRLDLGSFRLEI